MHWVAAGWNTRTYLRREQRDTAGARTVNVMAEGGERSVVKSVRRAGACNPTMTCSAVVVHDGDGGGGRGTWVE